MEQRLDPFYIKAGSANVFDMLIVNANNDMEFISANTLIVDLATEAINSQTAGSAEPPLHPFLLGGL